MSIRFATFNASLNRSSEGELITDLSTPDDAQVQAIAEIIQRTNPDVILINEFDFDAAGEAAALFQKNYLSVSQNGVDAIEYPYVYVAPSNTGISSGFDLNNNGTAVTTPGEPGYGDDAFGFGNFPGQFAFVVYSKYPIVKDRVRTFQKFLWKDMPGALLPADPEDANGDGDTENWFSPEELEVVRLSSKNHVDLPIKIDGKIVHVLVSHPTPPTFDGPEDRNGTRNHDEIRFWADYINGAAYIYDDNGTAGGLEPGSKFVIMGDQNADPFDGDSVNGAINQLLQNPLVNISVTPRSQGGADAAVRQGGVNATHLGDPANDTADFGFNAADPANDNAPGNLRVDYVLPSNNLSIAAAQVFWLASDDPLFPLGEFPTSDHRQVFVDVSFPEVVGIEFIGQATFPSGFAFDATEVGGLSSITYNAAAGQYYAISDDQNVPRFYTLNIDLTDGTLDDGDVSFTGVTTLLDEMGTPYAAGSIDPEGLVYNSKAHTLFFTSEGFAQSTKIANPFIKEITLAGKELQKLAVDAKFFPEFEGDQQIQGVRNNAAFESLTIDPNQVALFTATEDTLAQDGSRADLNNGGTSRIVKYDFATLEPQGEYIFEVSPIVEPANPEDAFKLQGVVELLALDNDTLLVLERSFSVGGENGQGTGFTGLLYEVELAGATDVSALDSLEGAVFTPVRKTLLLNTEDLGIAIDNVEGMTLGPVLPSGKQLLVIVADNDFNEARPTQFLAFALERDTTPSVPSVLETPSTVDDPAGDTPLLGDSDDPAIWVNPVHPDDSIVIVTLKDGGAAVLNLQGEIQQTILPADFGDIRYNNVDLVYNFALGNETVDLAVFSDRANDTLAIYAINPATQELTDVTADGILESIFGVDDGEATAYGLATYVSPTTGKAYAFVTQASGNLVAQLELVDNGDGTVNANLVRTIELPVPTGDVEDSQAEGLVIDQELGFLYVALENEVGILKVDAEPNGGSNFSLVQAIEADFLEPDLEGLSIYYGAEGRGYLIASSQGNSSFAVFDRLGANEYLRSFTVGETGLIDPVNESDGLDVTNVALGSAFPKGLLVVQDGDNDPQNPAADDEQLENDSTNFKFVDWAAVANALGLDIDPTSYDPRHPRAVDTLPNGVASGDVTQNSVVLWTRSLVAGEVTFAYSTDPTFGAIAGTVTATVTDKDLPVKVEVTGLTAGTDYYYRVTDAAGNSKVGQFETAAALGEKAGLRFGVSGDWRGELAPYPAISNANDADLAFFLEHGDTIYADYASPAVPKPQAKTLAEYRAKHAEVYSDRFNSNTWADLRAATAIYATIDDHEVINDFSGGDVISNDPRLLDAFPSDDPTALVNDSTLFDNGLQAFQEYNPIRDEFYGETGSDRTANERKLYRFNTFGSDAATFVLDTRSFRDAPLVAPDITNPSDIGRFLLQSATLDRQFLGDAQLAELKADLLTAEANGITWKFVMVPEPIQELGIYNVDAFEGYAKERTEILKFVEANDIDNVVFIAADIHGTFVNNLTYTEVVGGPRIATDVWEITTGSVAFDAPFGQTVIDFATAAGLLTPEQSFLYGLLPIAPDLDDIPNDKDDFLKLAFQTLAIGPGGYDPLGLNNNLTEESGVIGSFDVEANLLQGDYVAAHTFGWTQFDIDPVTQKLTVTTYGIEPYSEAELLANPQAILSRTPTIVSQFEVIPNFDPLTPVAELIDITGFEGIVSVNVTASREAGYDNLLKFYRTDAQGGLGGILPGDARYEDAVRASLLNSELYVQDGATLDDRINLIGGSYYAPALLIDGDLNNLATIGDNAMGISRIQRDGNVWRFEDWTDSDFNDLVLTVNSIEGAIA